MLAQSILNPALPKTISVAKLLAITSSRTRVRFRESSLRDVIEPAGMGPNPSPTAPLGKLEEQAARASSYSRPEPGNLSCQLSEIPQVAQRSELGGAGSAPEPSQCRYDHSAW